MLAQAIIVLTISYIITVYLPRGLPAEGVESEVDPNNVMQVFCSQFPAVKGGHVSFEVISTVHIKIVDNIRGSKFPALRDVPGTTAVSHIVQFV